MRKQEINRIMASKKNLDRGKTDWNYGWYWQNLGIRMRNWVAEREFSERTRN